MDISSCLTFVDESRVTLEETSSGNNLVIGLLFSPVLVRILAARTRSSLPLILPSMTPSFQLVLGRLSWIRTTSPVRIVSVLFPVVL